MIKSGINKMLMVLLIAGGVFSLLICGGIGFTAFVWPGFMVIKSDNKLIAEIGDEKEKPENKGKQPDDEKEVPTKNGKNGNPSKNEQARRHFEKAGGFSLVPPEGWTAKDFPGSQFKMFFGSNGNIVIATAPVKGTLDVVVKDLAAEMRGQKKVRLIEQKPFRMPAGYGVRLIVENEDENKRALKQTVFVVLNVNKMYALTCTTFAEGGEKFDPIFEMCAKTFRFEN